MKPFTVRVKLTKKQYLGANRELLKKELLSLNILVIFFFIFLNLILAVLLTAAIEIHHVVKQVEVNCGKVLSEFFILAFFIFFIILTLYKRRKQLESIYNNFRNAFDSIYKFSNDYVEIKSKNGEACKYLWRRFSEFVETPNYYFIKQRYNNRYHILPKKFKDIKEVKFIVRKIKNNWK